MMNVVALKKWLFFALIKGGCVLFLTLSIPVYFSNYINADNLFVNTLKNGVGVRPLSMGGAYCAVAEGPESIYYNPAGLVLPGFSAQYALLDYKKTAYSQADLFSFYFSPFSISHYVISDKLGVESIDTTAIGFGKRGNNGIHWGVVYKTIGYQNAGVRINGWSSDFGVLINVTPMMNLGVTAQDILSDKLAIPVTLRSGLSFFNPERTLIASTDLVYQKNKDLDWHVGLEYALTDSLILRSGAYKDTLTGGLNIVFGPLSLECGLIAPQKNGQETLYMISAQFGKEIQWPQNRRYVFFKEKAFAEVLIADNLVEGKSDASILGGKKLGSNDLLTYIHEARLDPNCQGFLVRINTIPNNLSSIALVQEIREEFQKARQDGKIVVAYLEDTAELPEYYLAAAADKIVMPRLGQISHLGVHVEIRKTKDFLDKFGIESKIIASGEFKGALQETGPTLNEKERAKLEELVGNLYNQVVLDIKSDRALNWEIASAIFDGRIISANMAEQIKLVDKIGYYETAKKVAQEFSRRPVTVTQNQVAQAGAKAVSVLTLNEFVGDVDSDLFFSPFNKIAVIEIDGDIHAGETAQDIFYGGKSTGADTLIKTIHQIKSDFSIRGVILRINSPGGSLLAVDRIYEAIEDLKKSGKTVYTSMGNMSASGGYYVALNSDKIIANPGSLTGSIGVISIFKEYQGFNHILGIQYDVVKTGKYMDMFSPNRKMTADEESIYRTIQKDYHQYFISKVVENRKLTVKEVEPLAQGQIFTGEQAKDLKLVDATGSFYDAVQDLAAKVNIQGEPRLVFYRDKTHRLL